MVKPEPFFFASVVFHDDPRQLNERDECGAKPGGADKTGGSLSPQDEFIAREMTHGSEEMHGHNSQVKNRGDGDEPPEHGTGKTPGSVVSYIADKVKRNS